MAIEGNTKFSDYPPQRTLTELQQDSNDVFVPVVTDDENYKLNVNELNSQKLVAGNNISISNDNVISAKDSFLDGDYDTIFVDNAAHKIYYIGQQGEAIQLIPSGGFNVSNNNVLNYSLNYGEEVTNLYSNTMANDCTSTYFIRDTRGGNKLIPYFAGYSNKLLIASFDSPNEVGKWRDKDLYVKGDTPECHSIYEQVDKNVQLTDAIINAIEQTEDLKLYPTDQTPSSDEFSFSLVLEERLCIHYNDTNDSSKQKRYYLYTDGTWGEDRTLGMIISSRTAGFSQFVFNIPDLDTIYLHTAFLNNIGNKEILLVNVNLQSVDTYIYPNQGTPITVQTWFGHKLKSIQIWNGEPVGSTCNFYFYHNGKVYTKLNDVGTSGGHPVIMGNLNNYKDNNNNDIINVCNTDLENSTDIITDIYGKRYKRDVQSGPFCTHIDYNEDGGWGMNTVNRFVCIVQNDSVNRIKNYYIIETMY